MPNLAKRPVALIIRDGWGHNPFPEWDKANAIVRGNTPVNDRLLAEYPNVQIHTSGEDVGLPAGVMGNSEVGHQNIGAGRIVDQEVMRITRNIREGKFFENEVLVGAFKHAEASGGAVHLLGLMSDGRVHSDLEHCKAIIELAARRKFPSERFFVHAIMDGRDTSPTGGLGYMAQVEDAIKQHGVGRVASVIGRYYAMDRDNRWDRVQTAYDLMTKGAANVFKSAGEAIQNYYDNPTEKSRTGDEFIEARSVSPTGSVEPAQRVKAGDAVIFFNYRGDRPREISKAFVLDEAELKAQPNGGFERGPKLDNLYFAGMTGYEKGLPIKVIFEKPAKMANILGQYASEQGLKQFRCAETEKFPHVTFFFNDYRDEPFPGESRGIVQSPKDVSTYDQKPEMSAPEVLNTILKQLDAGENDLYIINFANPDMVGHTGVQEAIIKAVEVVDDAVGQIVEKILAKGGAAVVTADHGNCEQMIDPETGGPHTAHTTYPVDLIVVDPRAQGSQLREGGRLADIAPTLLALLGLAKPAAMTGESLVEAGVLR